MRSTRTHSWRGKLPIATLRAILADVPDEATITVTKDIPAYATPLDPGGTVTLTASWDTLPPGFIRETLS